MISRGRHLLTALLLSSSILFPSMAQAYIGVGLGVVDEDNFGYSLATGMELPFNLGLDVQLVGFWDNGTTQDAYWVQGNIGLRYDFHELWKNVSETIELHPYVKGGFSYAANFIDRNQVTDIKASHGPGFHLGGGVDWKILPLLSVGFEVTESFLYLDGVTVNIGGVPTQISPDETAKVFSFLAMLKFFAY